MQRPRLKSKNGCCKCRVRRRKCDERKPSCGECVRLGFKCRWSDDGIATHPKPQTNVANARALETPHLTNNDDDSTWRSRFLLYSNEYAQERYIMLFDHPATLQASATSIVRDFDDKHVLHYLCEEGQSILRYPTQRYPAQNNVNSFRSGFPMALRSSIQMEAYLCLGAGYLSQLHSQYKKIALKHYNNVVFAFRSELQRCEQEPPAEWTCAVAAILSRYEMTLFHSPQSRLAHLIGFHRLVEARIGRSLPWGPLRMLLEHYVHSFSDSSIFHYELIVGNRPISYLDGAMLVLNDGPRPLGREIVGVPEVLTVAVFRLAFLNFQDASNSPWDVELMAVEAILATWQPPSYTLLPTGKDLLLVGKLYHLACICLLQHIRTRVTGVQSTRIASCLEEASLLVQVSDLRIQPLNSVAWPLVILGIFSVNSLQRLIFRQPLESLVTKARLKGYHSVLQFLSYLSQEHLGPEVLQRRDLLSMVHI